MASGFGQSYMFCKDCGMIGTATGCESDSTPTAGGGMAGKTAHASQEVCQVGSRSLDC